MSGVVAAGHPLTAEAGGRVLRGGGNAVDAAIAAMLTSFVVEPLLTGLGAGGYMLVATPGEAPVLLDFFVEAPGRGGGVEEAVTRLVEIRISFGDAEQVFHMGAAAAGTYGTPHGVCTAAARFGTVPLAELAAPAAALAREGARVNRQQAYLIDILSPIGTATAEGRALFAPEGRLLREGDVMRLPDLGDSLELLGAEGAAPFYRGDVARRIVDWLGERGGVLSHADLEAYATVDREPVRASFRGFEVVTNPPPSAGGILIAYALSMLDGGGPTTTPAVLDAMRAAQYERTPAFTAGLAEEGFQERFLASRLGSTTHISVIDGDGMACAVTCTNGEGCGEIVPGTGIHVNNIMGEQDLSPAGFFTLPVGRRMPSMMAPTVVLRDGVPSIALGSAGSNRIRSAVLQVVLNCCERGMSLREAVDAPRVHYEDGIVYAEPGMPGVDGGSTERAGLGFVRFRERNLFFGGCQAVLRDPVTGAFDGAGDPRRGGAVAYG